MEVAADGGGGGGRGVSDERVARGRGLRALSDGEWGELVDRIEWWGTRGDGLRSWRTVGGTRYEVAVWARNAAAVWLMGECGLRVAELCLLPWSAVWGAGGCLGACHVSTDVAKGGYERTIPINHHVEGALVRLREVLAELGGAASGARVWGVGTEWRPGGTRRVRAMVAALGSGAIGRAVRPHELRHTFATRLARVATVPVVQALLGHRSLSSTQRYLAVSWSERRAAVEALCGRAGERRGGESE